MPFLQRKSFQKTTVFPWYLLWSMKCFWKGHNYNIIVDLGAFSLCHDRQPLVFLQLYAQRLAYIVSTKKTIRFRIGPSLSEESLLNQPEVCIKIVWRPKSVLEERCRSAFDEKDSIQNVWEDILPYHGNVDKTFLLFDCEV